MGRIRSRLLWRLALPLALAALATLALSATASAATYTVTTTHDANDGSCTASLCSLRDAVIAADKAGGSSTITLPAGTYKITIPPASGDPNNATEGEFDVFNNASVTIDGAGSESTIVDANNLDRAFAVQQGGSLTLSGMTIEHGNPSSYSVGSPNGGGIYSDGALTLNGDVTLRDNNAPATATFGGGAIYTHINQSALNITGATFEDNGALNGGALYLNPFAVEATAKQSITDSTFISNNAPGGQGGAIDVNAGSLSVSGSTFTSNTSSNGMGGAIFQFPDPGYTLALTDNTLNANSALDGGALYFFGGNLTASGNTFDRNSANDGGAIEQTNQQAGSRASVFNNTFDANSAYEGGALYDIFANVQWLFDNNTLARNQANGFGGGIYQPGFVATGSTYANNIVALNTGGDCYANGYPLTAAQDPGNNLDSDGTCFGQNTGDKTGVNPDLGPLADNGGPTETDALLPGSPAIDTGNDSQCPSVDQRGVTRPQGPHCDIGAFEAAASNLSLSNNAPASATTNIPFTYTITVSTSGPGPSTGTTVTDQLPAGETLYGATPTQGTCSQSGPLAPVTCDLGSINVGGSANVTLLVAEANAGSVTDTATATNDQGASVNASATTTVTAPTGPTTTTPGPATTTSTTTTTTTTVPTTGGTAGVGVLAGVGAPTAITGPSSRRTKHAGRLSGTISPGGQTTWYFFQYGPTKRLGMATRLFRLSSAANVAATIRHLLAGKKYYFRLVAVNGNGISYGSQRSFRTRKVTTNKRK